MSTWTPASSSGGAALPLTGGSITGEVAITGVDTSARTLTVAAPASHSADVFRVTADASDTTNTEFAVDQHGNLRIASGGSYQEATLLLTDNTSGNPGSLTLDTFSGVIFWPEGTSNPILQLKPQTAHTGRLLTVLSTAAAETLAVSIGGYLLIKTHAAPADAALAAGECALWFDQTNGAAKLMVKAKQANGTAVTGEVALA